MEKLILASNSPRRKEILEKFGYNFEIMKSDYREEDPKELKEEDRINTLIKKNCYCKARTVAAQIASQAIVIGADTVVTLDSVCLLKPQNFSEAFLFLNELSDRTHVVKTATSVISIGFGREIELTEICETKVRFRKLEEREIIDYIEKFNPLDKAGAYGIQDFITFEQSKNPPKESFISEIQGSYYNVMGICPYKLKEMLEFVRVG